MKAKMFFGASPMIFENAKSLRKRQTDSERILWMALKQFFPNIKFRRQHPISIYIADFYCHKLKLVIEVDGLIHERSEVRLNDAEREYYLKQFLGLNVLRFTNAQVMNEIEEVIKTIEQFISSLPREIISPLRGTGETTRT